MSRSVRGQVLFSDEVVLATDLKKRQRYWLDRARQTGGVTIVQGKAADLVLASRREVAQAMEAATRGKQTAQFLREVLVLGRKAAESGVFPWLAGLDEQEGQEFLRELVEAFVRSSTMGSWAEFDELLDDWQATAEAHRLAELKEAWQSRGKPEEYGPMEAPGGG
jgi:hypothetical protein